MKNLFVFFRGIMLVLFISFLVSCDNNQEKKVWEETSNTNTMESYEAYLSQFPEGTHTQEANDKIQEFYFKEAEISVDPIAVYSEYKVKYPQGTYDPSFETIIYNYTILKNEIRFFEEYARLFPDGKYLDEFEALIYTNILDGGSSLSLADYMQRFPEGKHIVEIDSILYDSLFVKLNLDDITSYNELFPQNTHQVELDSLKEEINYLNTLQSNKANDFNFFLNNFPESNKLVTLNISCTPENAKVTITDENENEFTSLELPGEIQIIRGAKVILNFSAPKFHDLAFNYTVLEDSLQSVSQSLKSSNVYSYIDEFNNPTSSWAESKSDYQFVLDNNGHLVCQTRERQLQVLKDLPINYQKNFKVEIRFSISSIIEQYLSYYGIVWGDEYQLKYFFVSNDGHRNIGSQENNLRSPSNEFGYSRWVTSTNEINSWPLASTFNEGGYNVIIMENKNKTITYKINGQTIFQENIKTPRDNYFGFGMGNANVIVDYIKISK